MDKKAVADVLLNSLNPEGIRSIPGVLSVKIQGYGLERVLRVKTQSNGTFYYRIRVSEMM